ncbi:uncharacterized protein Dana_GF18183, isoform C [Drosophila ananassae]|uniref:Uncharacterized protein, isoform C n=1 Tax=Drosophila ananassae TaxID=7217 RepID=A0A0P8YM68_DROAN|nr:uncharacterized protein Dana_GF18183, isoform C [Drosophila ananassae]
MALLHQAHCWGLQTIIWIWSVQHTESALIHNIKDPLPLGETFSQCTCILLSGLCRLPAGVVALLVRLSDTDSPDRPLVFLYGLPYGCDDLKLYAHCMLMQHRFCPLGAMYTSNSNVMYTGHCGIVKRTHAWFGRGNRG